MGFRSSTSLFRSLLLILVGGRDRHNRLSSALHMNMLNYNFLLTRLALQLRHSCQLLDEEPHQPGRSEHIRS